jgi:DNA recombination protein RmuC
MLPAIIALQVLTLIALLVLLLRKPASAQEAAADPRLAQLLAADLPTQITRLDARSETLDKHMRDQTAELRTETAAANTALRSEIVTNLTTLGATLRTSLDTARKENEAAAESLRSRVQQGLEKLNTDNNTQLEQMRVTVDEKLHATLQTRLTESFGTIAEQLVKVHEGLGEMSSMTSEVKSLSRIFSNVKTRGGVAEEMVETLLDEVLAPGQYQRNVNVRPGTQEVVEFAVRLPGMGDEVWLPIDAKFPREDWERLESANDSGDPLLLEPARKAFDSAIRAQAKLISSKYINEPITTPYAIMFLPTESMYAEVLRRDGLQAYMHQTCRVMVAGPTNLYALLTSFRLGFRMLNLQKKGDEVWKVLAATQTEFGKFGGLIDKMDKQVGTVQNTIRDLGVRTRAINRTLSDVSADAQGISIPASTQAGFDGFLPTLAANEEADVEKEDDRPQ